MSDLRQKFEALPEFKCLLENCEWCEEDSAYSNNTGDIDLDYQADACSGGFTAFCIQQKEIDQLKAENIRLTGLLKEQKRCFDECSQMVSDLIKERDQLKAEKEVVLELAKQWQETARQLSITDDKHVICSLLGCAEEVEEALRGEHE